MTVKEIKATVTIIYHSDLCGSDCLFRNIDTHNHCSLFFEDLEERAIKKMSGSWTENVRCDDCRKATEGTDD